MKVLNNRELYNLDQELFKFRGIDRAIWVRRAELMSSNGEEIVGSRGGGISKPTESTVIKLSTDVPLRNLELFKETVETFIKELTTEQHDIFELRWGQACLDWEEIAEKMHISTATVYRKRNNILETYARTKGIL
ncbi:transcriptional regulator [Streptococcus cristatus]|uniref:transcriptional regulator n=1 Tax=Streptococcus cristatus TaxID=45634 RepID=UPI0039C1338D